MTEYVGTRVNNIVSCVQDPAVVAAISSLTQVIEYQRRDLAALGRQLRVTQTQVQNVGTSVNSGYLHMSTKYDTTFNWATICQKCNIDMYPSPNRLGYMRNVHNPIDVYIPRQELEIIVQVPIIANNQPETTMATAEATTTATATTTTATTSTTTTTMATTATAIATMAVNGEVTPTDLARAAGIDAINRLRACNQPHRPNMSLIFPATWSIFLAEWRVENLSDFDRKGVPAGWKDSKLQQRYAKRLRCIRLIRRIAASTDPAESESSVVEDLDRMLNARTSIACPSI